MRIDSPTKSFGMLTASAVIVKALGFLYKLPLTNFLGSEGLGLYQLIFPVYSLLLTMSSSAFPTVISRKIKSDGGLNYLLNAKRTLNNIGLIGFLFLAASSYPLSIVLNEPRSFVLFLAVSPSVYFVANIAFYKGVAQGKMNFRPSAVSEIIGQGMKIALGFVFILIYKDNLFFAVTMAVSAITLSEAVTLIYMKKKVPFSYFKGYEKQDVFKEALPFSAAFSVLPLIIFIESGIITNFGGGISNFGLYSGVALGVAGIPVTIISALGSVFIPIIAIENRRKYAIKKGFAAAALIAAPFSAAFLFLPNEIVGVICYKLELVEKLKAANIIKSIWLLPIVESVYLFSSSVLYGMNKGKIVFRSSLVGGILRIVILSILLYGNYGIENIGLSAISHYSLAAVVNLVYIIFEEKVFVSLKSLIAMVFYFGIVYFGLKGIASITSGLNALIWGVLFCITTLFTFSITLNLIKINVTMRKKNAN